MPRENAFMSWAAGVGGEVPLLVDDRVVRGVPTPCADWLRYDGVEVVCSTWGDGGGFRIIAVNGTTGATRVLHAEGEYNNIVAGGGHWGGQHISGQWQVDGVPTPLVDPDDPQLGNLPVIGFGRDGSIVTKANHYAGLVVDGTRWSSELVWDVTIIAKNTGIWQSNSGVYVRGMPMPMLLPGTKYHLRVAKVNGQWWPLYLAADANGQLVTHPPDSLIGYAFTTPGANCDRPDIGSDGQYQLCVVWGTAESEGPGQVKVSRPNIMRDPRYRLVSAPVPSVPPVVVPPPIVIPPVIQEPPVPTDIDYLGIITDVRKKYGHFNEETEQWTPPLGENLWKANVEIAQRTQTLLFLKPGGDHVEIPPLSTPGHPVFVSLDVIGRGSLGNHWADIWGDAEGEARPAFSIGNGPADGNYLDVSSVVLPGQPQPPDPPTGDCPRRVAALEDTIRRAIAVLQEAL